MNATCSCSTNNRSSLKQLNIVVRHQSKHLRNSQKIIGKALEDIPKLLEALSESFDYDVSRFTVDERNVSLFNEYLKTLKLERDYCSHCKLVQNCVCTLNEQGAAIETTRENTARHFGDVSAAKATGLKESRIETFVYLQPKKGNTIDKAIEHTDACSREDESQFERVKEFKNCAKQESVRNSGRRNLTAFGSSYNLESSSTTLNKCKKDLRLQEIKSEDESESKSTWDDATIDDLNIHSTILKTDVQESNLDVRYQNGLESLNLGDSLQQSPIERFSIVLRSVMEGIESCTYLATTLTSSRSNLATNRNEVPDNYPLEDTMVTAALSERRSSTGEIVKVPMKNTVRIFDFTAEESERLAGHPEQKVDFGDSSYKEKHQIDIEAEFSSTNSEEKSLSIQNLHLSKKLDKIDSIGTPGNSGAMHNENSRDTEELQDAKESSRVQRQNESVGVRRNKSTKADRGFKFFKRRFFSKSTENNSVKSGISGKASESPPPSWEGFDISGVSGEATLRVEEGKQTICQCGTPRRISELENTIEQLENEKNKLEEEKLDLMNALSNIWIQMEDLKSECDKEDLNKGNTETIKPSKEDKTKMESSHQEIHNSDSSLVNTKGISPDFIERKHSSQEVSHSIPEGLSKEDLENEIKTLTKTKNVLNETIQSLRIKLSVVNEDKESLSRKVSEMFDKNKALEEEIRKLSGNSKPEFNRIVEENISFRSSLEILSSDKLLLEKNNQKLRIEKKKQKLVKLQIQKGCEGLIERINQVLQTTGVEKVGEVFNEPKSNPAPSGSSSSSCNTSSDSNKSNKISVGECSKTSSNLDENSNSVKQIVRKLERTKSNDNEVRAREKMRIEAFNPEERNDMASPTTSIRRAETLNSKTVNADGKRKEMRVNRFPPAQSSKVDKFRKDLKSPSGEDISFRPLRPPGSQVPSRKSISENESDPCLKFFEHLEAKCLVVLERFTVLNEKIECLERNNAIPDFQRTVNGTSLPDPTINFENVHAQGIDRKDVILLSCLRNLQRENDTLKLSNLKYKALVANMQDRWNEGLRERIDDEITAEKNSIRRAVKDLHDLEVRVVPERDFGSFESEDKQLSKFVTARKEVVENGKDFPGESGGTKNGLKYSEGDFAHEQQEIDMSSWHRKHSRRSKENGRALVVNEGAPKQINGLLDGLNDLDTHSVAYCSKTVTEQDGSKQNEKIINAAEKSAKEREIVRALSLDEGKTARLNEKQSAVNPTFNVSEQNKSNSANKVFQGDNQESRSALIATDEPPLNVQAQCCQTFKVHGHHHQHCTGCSSTLTRLKTMTLVGNSDAPPKHRENNKPLKKAKSSCGSRDRQYKIHYV